MYLALSNYPREAQDKRSQHFKLTSPDIVGAFGHPVAKCWLLLAQI